MVFFPAWKNNMRSRCLIYDADADYFLLYSHVLYSARQLQLNIIIVAEVTICS